MSLELAVFLRPRAHQQTAETNVLPAAVDFQTASNSVAAPTAVSLETLLQQQLHAARFAEQQRKVEEIIYIWSLHSLSQGSMTLRTSLDAQQQSTCQQVQTRFAPSTSPVHCMNTCQPPTLLADCIPPIFEGRTTSYSQALDTYTATRKIRPTYVHIYFLMDYTMKGIAHAAAQSSTQSDIPVKYDCRRVL